MAAWLALVAVAAGCGAEKAEHVETEPPAFNLFDKNKGVSLPPEMKGNLGVQTVEVLEKRSSWHVKKPAQVYHAAEAAKPAKALALLTEAEVAMVRAGQAITLRSTTSPGGVIAATVVRVDAAAAALGHVEALIEFPDAERRWQPGSFLAASFTHSSTNSALTVPESAVIRGAEGAFVYTASGEHFVRTPVKVGVVTDGSVEISDGLYAGDVVVAKAADSLWMIELCALKGGTPCCPVPMKKQDK